LTFQIGTFFGIFRRQIKNRLTDQVKNQEVSFHIINGTHLLNKNTPGSRCEENTADIFGRNSINYPVDPDSQND
jgi:hypothetical protein